MENKNAETVLLFPQVDFYEDFSFSWIFQSKKSPKLEPLFKEFVPLKIYSQVLE